MTLRNHVHRKSRAYAREQRRFMRGVEPGLYELVTGPLEPGSEKCDDCPYCVERCGDDEEEA